MNRAARVGNKLIGSAMQGEFVHRGQKESIDGTFKADFDPIFSIFKASLCSFLSSRSFEGFSERQNCIFAKFETLFFA